MTVEGFEGGKREGWHEVQSLQTLYLCYLSLFRFNFSFSLSCSSLFLSASIWRASALSRRRERAAERKRAASAAEHAAREEAH